MATVNAIVVTTPSSVSGSQPATSTTVTRIANATFPANGTLENQGTASVLYLGEGPTNAGCPPAATGCKATDRAASSGLLFAFPALGANPNVVAFDETSGKRLNS